MLSASCHAITMYRNRKGWRNTRKRAFLYTNNRSLTNNLPRSFAENCTGKLEPHLDCGFWLQGEFGAEQDSRVADVFRLPLKPPRTTWFVVADRNANCQTLSACRTFWGGTEARVRHGCICGTGNFLRLARVSLSVELGQIDSATKREKPEPRNPRKRRGSLHTCAAKQ